MRRREENVYIKHEETRAMALEIIEMWIKIFLHDSKPGNQFRRSLESFCETSG